MMTTRLSRTAASEAVEDLGWRYVLGAFRTYVPVGSTAEALAVGTAAMAACSGEADEQLAVDARADRAELVLFPRTSAHVDERSIALARAVTAALSEGGWHTAALPGSSPHGVQALEIAIDTMDRSAIQPFWKAVLGYVDDPGSDDAIVDPWRQGPVVWFQQMDEPRTQRNRIHFDITVPHDDAESRIKAALDAGGVLVSDVAARSFWILADVEGNEICICTWQDRD
jgi:4a-hydroxytetrahydrobiopterin dehydratase